MNDTVKSLTAHEGLPFLNQMLSWVILCKCAIGNHTKNVRLLHSTDVIASLFYFSRNGQYPFCLWRPLEPTLPAAHGHHLPLLRPDLYLAQYFVSAWFKLCMTNYSSERVLVHVNTVTRTHLQI